MSKEKRRERLILLRDRAGLTQDDVGDRLGCPRVTISKLENGVLSLTPRWRKALSSLYGVAQWELLEDAPLMTDDERRILEAAARMSQSSRQTLLDLAEKLAGPKSSQES